MNYLPRLNAAQAPSGVTTFYPAAAGRKPRLLFLIRCAARYEIDEITWLIRLFRNSRAPGAESRTKPTTIF
jgi:hypothetical protein